jgi:hypothetical protein
MKKVWIILATVVIAFLVGAAPNDYFLSAKKYSSCKPGSGFQAITKAKSPIFQISKTFSNSCAPDGWTIILP